VLASNPMRSMLCAALLHSLLVSAAPASAAPSFQAAFPGRDPALQWDTGGNLHAVYIEEQGGEAAVWYRRLGASPAGPVRVSPPGAKVDTNGNAPPILAILRGGLLVTAYPVSLPGHWKSEVRVQRSTDRGVSWSAGILAHPQRVGAHSYLSAAVTPAGLLTLAWLDDSSGHMGVQAATTADGLTFSPRRTVDASTCECCDTMLLAGRGGTVWLAYRDVEGEDVRDFRVLKSTAPPLFADGTKLSNDNWHLKGCPDTGARLAEAADGTLWAAWFTGGGQTGIYVTSSRDLSRDGGARFAPRTLLTPAAGLYRHPEIGVLPGNRTAVVYEGVDTGGAFPGHPLLARLRDPRTGAWSAARRVAPQGSFPRLAVLSGERGERGERAALAFTCRAGQQTRVVIADWQLLGDGGLPWAGCDRL
jgi:hypothetical protein